jgi:hypothetical protein
VLINKTRRETQLKLYKVMADPVLIYRLENWTLSGNYRTEIKTAETKHLL